MREIFGDIISALTSETWTQSWRHRTMAVTLILMALYCATVQAAFETAFRGRARIIETWLIRAAFIVSISIEWALGLRAPGDGEYGQ